MHVKAAQGLHGTLPLLAWCCCCSGSYNLTLLIISPANADAYVVAGPSTSEYNIEFETNYETKKPYKMKSEVAKVRLSLRWLRCLVA